MSAENAAKNGTLSFPPAIEQMLRDAWEDQINMPLLLNQVQTAPPAIEQLTLFDPRKY
jgi:hypothetical protein